MTEVDLITTFWRTASGTSQRWLSSRRQGACSMLVKSYIASMSQSKVLCGRVIIELNEVTARELQPAITVLQLFLSSSKPTLRFAAIRALNKVAMVHPLSVTSCNIDMESLISDQNRSIATLVLCRYFCGALTIHDYRMCSATVSKKAGQEQVLCIRLS